MRTSLQIFVAAAAAIAALSTGVAQAEPATYAIDPSHTFATFQISHFGASVNRGRFDKKEGTVQFDRAGKSGKVDVTFDTGSINTGTPAFDKHIKANQFNCYQSPMLKREVCGGDFEGTLDRTAFGMDYGVQYGFDKNVRLIVQVEAVKK